MSNGIFYTMGLKTGGFTGPLSAAQSAVSGFSGGVAGLVTKMAALAGAAGGVAGVVMGMRSALDLGGTLNDLAARTGVPIAQLAVLQQAFRDAGMGAEMVGPHLNKLQKALAGMNEDGEPTGDMFVQLGLSIDALRNQTAPQQLEAVGAAIRNLADPAQRAMAAMSLFGRSGGEMLALFADSGAISNAAAVVGGQAELLGKSAASFDTASDLLGAAGTKVRGFFVGVADQVVGGMMPLLEEFKTLDLSSIGAQVGDIVGTLGEGFSEIFSSFRTSSTASFSEMLSSGLGTAKRLADSFVGTVRTFKAAFASGEIGNILGASLKIAFYESVNTLYAGLHATMNAVGQYMIEAGRTLLTYLDVLSTPDFWKGMGNALMGVGISFSAFLQKGLAELLEVARPIAELFGKGAKIDAAQALLRQTGAALQGEANKYFTAAGDQIAPLADKITARWEQAGKNVTARFAETFRGTADVMDASGERLKLKDSLAKVRETAKGMADAAEQTKRNLNATAEELKAPTGKLLPPPKEDPDKKPTAKDGFDLGVASIAEAAGGRGRIRLKNMAESLLGQEAKTGVSLEETLGKSPMLRGGLARFLKGEGYLQGINPSDIRAENLADYARRVAGQGERAAAPARARGLREPEARTVDTLAKTNDLLAQIRDHFAALATA